MGISVIRFKLLLLATCFLPAAGMVVHAQQGGGQPIIFSSPGDTADSSAPSSIAVQPDNSPKDTLQVPQSFAPDRATALPAPTVTYGSRPAMTETERLKKMLNGRKDWVFMTPAEMLGVDNSKNALAVPDRDAAGNRKTLTPAERYTERLNQSRMGYTNSPSGSSPGWDFSNYANNPAAMPNGNPNLISAPNNNGWLNNREADSAWARLTGPASSQPSPNSDQQKAVMEQFRQLLESSRPVPAARLETLTTPASSSKSPWDAIASKPVMNPAGATVAPLTTGIGVPTAVPALPVLGAPLPVKVEASPGAPQPAPWLFSGPQPGVIPQRKF